MGDNRQRKMCQAETVTIRIPEARSGLLREVLEKRSSKVVLLRRERSAVVIRRDRLKLVQDIIGDELVETGLREDGEPNDRGLALEELIDLFSPYN